MINNQRPRRVLIYGDFIPSGFGRICRALGQHLAARGGYELIGACIQWDGILPLQPSPMPFHVCALNGRDAGQGPAGFANVVQNIVGAYRPDVIVSVQDFPYHEALRAARIDWSVTGHVVITPVDGVPVAQRWLDLVPQFDSFMTISEFGVEAFRAQGLRAALCPPGVDTGEFYRMPDSDRAAMRERLNIPKDAFVVGVMAMNQGRKDFPSMVAAFAEAYRANKDAYLYLDCEALSPAGWDIEGLLLKHNNIPRDRVRFRGDAVTAGVVTLNARYNLLDLHMVIAHREGYGLPHGEAMATGVPSVTLDYCSGPEIIGDNVRGWLVPSAPPHSNAYGTWGGALDHWPDMPALVAALREAYEKPGERAARGERALEWVKQRRTWARAGDAVIGELDAIFKRRATDFEKKYEQPPTTTPQVVAMQNAMPAGNVTVYHVNAPIQVVANTPDEFAAGLAQKVNGNAELVSLVESEQA